MNPEILERKGARKVLDVPVNVLKHLNNGEIETVNLTEWLAIDHLVLINAVLPNMGVSVATIADIAEQIKAIKKPTAMQCTKVVGSLLYTSTFKDEEQLESLFQSLSNHRSDAVRCYAPYLVACDENKDISQKLQKMRELVADSHFGVREVVWMALRPSIEDDLDQSIEILTGWTNSEDENIRRFTTEATRPRGVWCKHIERLKESPELALPILENLKSDSSKYVQDSVGNWLNDASKTRPQFVSELCNTWSIEFPTKATARIIKKARRTIDK